MKLYDDPDSEQHIWEVREAGLGATAFIPGKEDTHEGWEGLGRSRRALGEYLRRLSKLADKYGYESSLTATRPGLRPRPLELRPGHEARHREVPALARGRERPRARARRLVVRRARRRPVARGAPAEDVRRRPRPRFREFKSIWDPDWKMNPGKVVRPYRVDENLRPRRRLRAVAAEGQVRVPARPTATSRTRPSAVSASASAARPTGSTSCARRSWRRVRRCTPPAAARVSCSRCSKGRSSPTAGSRTR
jgi:hypothetical protein